MGYRKKGIHINLALDSCHYMLLNLTNWAFKQIRNPQQEIVDSATGIKPKAHEVAKRMLLYSYSTCQQWYEFLQFCGIKLKIPPKPLNLLNYTIIRHTSWRNIICIFRRGWLATCRAFPGHFRFRHQPHGALVYTRLSYHQARGEKYTWSKWTPREREVWVSPGKVGFFLCISLRQMSAGL